MDFYLVASSRPFTPGRLRLVKLKIERHDIGKTNKKTHKNGRSHSQQLKKSKTNDRFILGLILHCSKCSQLSAFETIYKKYISTMEEKENEPCCPLCHRQFNALKEMKKLVDEVDTELIIILTD